MNENEYPDEYIQEELDEFPQLLPDTDDEDILVPEDQITETEEYDPEVEGTEGLVE